MRKLPKNIHSIKGVGRTEPDTQSDIILPDGVQVPIGKPVMNIDFAGSLLYNEYPFLCFLRYSIEFGINIFAHVKISLFLNIFLDILCMI